jgi:putative transposase
MKKKFSEEQIIKILAEMVAGKTAKEISRDKGVTIQTIYSWKKKFGGVTSDEAKKLRALKQ